MSTPVLLTLNNCEKTWANIQGAKELESHLKQILERSSSLKRISEDLSLQSEIAKEFGQFPRLHEVTKILDQLGKVGELLENVAIEHDVDSFADLQSGLQTLTQSGLDGLKGSLEAHNLQKWTELKQNLGSSGLIETFSKLGGTVAQKANKILPRFAILGNRPMAKEAVQRLRTLIEDVRNFVRDEAGDSEVIQAFVESAVTGGATLDSFNDPEVQKWMREKQLFGSVRVNL
jgi:hypothetical protein